MCGLSMFGCWPTIRSKNFALVALSIPSLRKMTHLGGSGVPIYTTNRKTLIEYVKGQFVWTKSICHFSQFLVQDLNCTIA